MILAGDVGGTKSWLVLANNEEGSWRTLHEEQLVSADFVSIAELVRKFVAAAEVGTEQISAACLAVAGPVLETGDNQSSELTNLPWQLDRNQLADQLKIDSLRLVNDFVAAAEGIDQLSAADIVTLQAGTPRAGNRLIVGAGTGLGVALQSGSAKQRFTLATEAGHADFAPSDMQQTNLRQHCSALDSRVTLETLLSGSGLVRIFEFLSAAGDEPPGESIREALKSGDQAATISRYAIEQQDRVAVSALEMFTTIYGSTAGDLALATGAWEGVFIAGGIAPKIMPLLTSELFLDAFVNKPPMASLLLQIPVRVITNPKVGVLGALAGAKQLLGNR